MRYMLFVLATAFTFMGCSATVKGVKEDASTAADWTKQKINEAATVIKEKTE